MYNYYINYGDVDMKVNINRFGFTEVNLEADSSTIMAKVVCAACGFGLEFSDSLVSEIERIRDSAEGRYFYLGDYLVSAV